jgi:hypothetical protein
VGGNSGVMGMFLSLIVIMVYRYILIPMLVEIIYLTCIGFCNYFVGSMEFESRASCLLVRCSTMCTAF